MAARAGSGSRQSALIGKNVAGESAGRASRRLLPTVSTTERANLSRTLGRALAAAVNQLGRDTDQAQRLRTSKRRTLVAMRAADWLGPARLLTPADGQGTIFAALVSVRQGVRDPFGGMAAGVAGGRRMHHDHGSPYMRDDWHAELRCLGSVSSPAFVRQPEGNGSVERFFRTLKEQLFRVRHLTDVEALQQALRIFKATDHQPWVIERLGFRAHAGRMSF